ncbi:MAG: phage baseplate protein [Deltaproteobacteria bacterium]|jgi:hypothetical protein
MRALTVPELLKAWEEGLGRTLAERALVLLAAACPDTSREALARLSIGQRNLRLLKLREQTFGPQIVGLARCPHCGEQLELIFRTDDLKGAPEAEPEETLMLRIEGDEVQFRLPNSLDLALIDPHQDLAHNRQLILKRCLLKVSHAGEARSLDHLSADAVEAIMARMAKADPHADVSLNVACVQCGQKWQAPFDIGRFFWTEIHAWAIRVLDELHLLASAYGWSESDLLAMSQRRRQFYLERIGG